MHTNIHTLIALCLGVIFFAAIELFLVLKQLDLASSSCTGLLSEGFYKSLSHLHMGEMERYVAM